MNVHIVYIFLGPILIKFSKGDIHKNVLGISSFMQDSVNQCFSTAGSRPSTGSWHQLYWATRGSPGSYHFSFLSIFHE
jgi:hypothetical protein